MTLAMLSAKAFAASRRFVQENARPLEVARLRHAFDGASGDAVLDALKSYQNPDGGFGRALEPDLRADESSALCTSVAFQVLRATQPALDEALVTRGVAYLLNTLDKDKAHWRIIPRSAEESPHAPWWNQTGREDVFNGFSLNPTAEILGYLFDYRRLVPQDIIALVSDRVADRLIALETIEMHELLCCVRLLGTEALTEELRERIWPKVAQLANETVARDPIQWKTYGLRPLQVADDPSSQFMAHLDEPVAANLDYEITSQNEDGSWSPTWSWGSVFPDAWEQARREWSGIITVEKLLLLKAFRRIEGIA